MTTASGLLAHAVTLGLVRPADVLDGEVSLHEQSRSNVVHRVALTGRPVAFVKQAGAAARLSGTDPVTRERAVLRSLDGLGGVPALLDSDRLASAPVLWTVPVDGTALGELDLRMRDVEPVARALGTRLARLHTWPASLGSAPATRPWVLSPWTLPHWMDAGADGLARSVVDALRDEPPLAGAADRVSASWATTTWIHGDPSPSNVLVDDDGAVGFIDFEDAGLGDPSWDLACALASLRLVVTSWGRVADGGAGSLLAAYAAAGGPGAPDADRCCLAALMIAWQVAASAASASPPTPAHEARVVDLLAVARCLR